MYTYIKKLKRGRYQGYGHGGSIITHQKFVSYRALKAQEKNEIGRYYNKLYLNIPYKHLVY